jgi:hypothetical protein
LKRFLLNVPHMIYPSYVRAIAHQAMHLHFDISANTIEIRAVLRPQYLVWCAVNCTYRDTIKIMRLCVDQKLERVIMIVRILSIEVGCGIL